MAEVGTHSRDEPFTLWPPGGKENERRGLGTNHPPHGLLKYLPQQTHLLNFPLLSNVQHIVKSSWINPWVTAEASLSSHLPKASCRKRWASGSKC